MILEVCVDSFKSLLTAKAAGADRIELCSALSLGGLTPSYGLMEQAIEVKDIEIFVMIRPRSGDFLYDEFEFETIKKDIISAKKMGFNGIVTGILLKNGKLDLERMEEIAEIAKPLKVVLHRAFDDALEPENDIEALIDMGIIRILTSGQRSNALEGAGYIGEIQKQYGNRITIMPGCGISKNNIEKIYNITGCKHFHMSGKTNTGSKMVYKGYMERMNTPPSELTLEEASYDKIHSVRKILNSLN